MSPETGEEAIRAALLHSSWFTVTVKIWWLQDEGMIKLCLIFDTHRIKQCLMDELHCLCVALLFDDGISSLIKWSMQYDTVVFVSYFSKTECARESKPNPFLSSWNLSKITAVLRSHMLCVLYCSIFPLTSEDDYGFSLSTGRGLSIYLVPLNDLLWWISDAADIVIFMAIGMTSNCCEY